MAPDKTTDAQIRAIRKYERENYTFYGVRLRKDQAEEFEKYRKEKGLSKNAAITLAVEKLIKE